MGRGSELEGLCDAMRGVCKGGDTASEDDKEGEVDEAKRFVEDGKSDAGAGADNRDICF